MISGYSSQKSSPQYVQGWCDGLTIGVQVGTSHAKYQEGGLSDSQYTAVKFAEESGPGLFQNQAIVGHNDAMNTPISAELLDAKLEALTSRWERDLSARDEARAKHELEVERERAQREADLERQRAQRDEARFAKLDAIVERLDLEAGETKAAIGNLKSTLIITAISSVLAIVLGVAAFNATVLSNMVAAFESGKNTSAAQAQVQQQLKETQDLLNSLKQQAASPPAKPAK